MVYTPPTSPLQNNDNVDKFYTPLRHSCFRPNCHYQSHHQNHPTKQSITNRVISQPRPTQYNYYTFHALQHFMPQAIPGRAREWGGITRSEYFAEPILATRPIRHAPSQKKLPVELIDEILSYLTDRPDICSVLQTSKLFHDIMLPKSWKDVTVYPRIGGEVLRMFTGLLDKPCAPFNARGEQVEGLNLLFRKPNKMRDIRDVYIPIYLLLENLPNITHLALHVGQYDPARLMLHISQHLTASTPWKPRDIDLRKQLPIKSLVFTPPQVKTRDSMSHPTSRFEKWLFSQEQLEYFEYHTRHKIPFKFHAKWFPNLRCLKISSENVKMTKGLVGSRPITHLKVTVSFMGLSSSFRLPPALTNVLVLARDDNDLKLAVLFPNLQRLDIEYEKGLDLGWFFYHLRYEDRSQRGNFQNLRLLRVWGIRITGKENCKVDDIFKELAGLECFEVMRDDVTCTRYARDGTTRVVRWTCDKSEVWYHDWEEGVTTEDSDSPLIFFTNS